jgi:hypothetical protein
MINRLHKAVMGGMLALALSFGGAFALTGNTEAAASCCNASCCKAGSACCNNGDCCKDGKCAKKPDCCKGQNSCPRG